MSNGHGSKGRRPLSALTSVFCLVFLPGESGRASETGATRLFVVEDRVVVLREPAGIEARQIGDGAVLWQTRLPWEGGQRWSLLAGDSDVILLDLWPDREILAMSSTTGRMLWRRNLEPTSPIVSTGIQGSTASVVQSSGIALSFNSATGATTQEFRIAPRAGWGSLAFGPDFLVHYDESKSGLCIWHSEPWELSRCLSSPPQLVLAAFDAIFVTRREMPTPESFPATEIRETMTGGVLWRRAPDAPRFHPELCNGNLLIRTGFRGTASSLLQLVSPVAGDILWSREEVISNLLDSMACTDGAIVIQREDDATWGAAQLRGLDGRTGELTWSRRVVYGGLELSPKTWGQTVVFSVANQIRAVDARSGTVEWGTMDGPDICLREADRSAGTLPRLLVGDPLFLDLAKGSSTNLQFVDCRGRPGFRLAITAAFPGGLSFDPTKVQIEGAPIEAGRFRGTITACSGESCSRGSQHIRKLSLEILVRR